MRCLASGSRPRSSTSSSVISTATRRASSRPTTGPPRSTPTSSPSPSSRSRATRPRTSCSGPRSWPTRPRRSAKIAARTGTTAAVVGFPELLADGALANSAALCAQGEVQGVYRKHLLPNYAVFDEQRYFEPSTVDGPLFTVAGLQVALTVCEDAWSADRSRRHAGRGRCRGRREHQRVAVLRGPGARARGDARPAGDRGRGADRLREPRRRSGRARLRRRVDGHRRRRHRGRAGRPVRGGPARRRPRRAPRPPPARARPVGRSREPLPTVAVSESHLGLPSRPTARRAAARPGARGVPGARARHARLRGEERVLRTWCSGSRAASTRRSSPRSPSTRSDPTRSPACCMPSRYLERGEHHRLRRARRAALGIATLTIPIEPAHEAFTAMLAESVHRAPSPASPRRTSRRASAARS